MKKIILSITIAISSCFILFSSAQAASLTNNLQLCSIDQSTIKQDIRNNKLLKLAVWRQCEAASDCGSGQHCCEIGGGESRCYSDDTAC